MAIPIGQLAVAAARTAGGWGQGRLLGHQLAQTEADKARQQQAEMLRMSLLLRTVGQQDSERAALQDFLTTHGAADLTGLPTGAATSLYSSRQPTRPSPSEDRLVAEALHRRRLAAAKGDAEGLVARYGRSMGPAARNPQFIHDFLKKKYPDLADGELWDIVGDFTVPKKAAPAGLDLEALKASLPEAP